MSDMAQSDFCWLENPRLSFASLVIWNLNFLHSVHPPISWNPGGGGIDVMEIMVHESLHVKFVTLYIHEGS